MQDEKDNVRYLKTENTFPTFQLYEKKRRGNNKSL